MFRSVNDDSGATPSNQGTVQNSQNEKMSTHLAKTSEKGCVGSLRFMEPCCQYNQVIETNKICANHSSQGKKRSGLYDLWLPSNKLSKSSGIFESPCMCKFTNSLTSVH